MMDFKKQLISLLEREIPELAEEWDRSFCGWIVSWPTGR